MFKMKKQVHNLKELESQRKYLRSNLTAAEAYLWNYLKKSQLKGRKFRRQHSISHFIVDFNCPQEKLIIELDGQHHLSSNAMEYNEFRTKKLNDLGYTVIRFENKMVFDLLPSVLKEIENNFKC